jgi:hypothetical protein
MGGPAFRVQFRCDRNKPPSRPITQRFDARRRVRTPGSNLRLPLPRARNCLKNVERWMVPHWAPPSWWWRARYFVAWGTTSSAYCNVHAGRRSSGIQQLLSSLLPCQGMTSSEEMHVLMVRQHVDWKLKCPCLIPIGSASHSAYAGQQLSRTTGTAVPNPL